jgi:predicted transposase YdaD
MGGQILEYEGKTIFNEGRQEGRKEGRQEGLQEGRKEGRQEGINQTNERVATDMLLKKKFSISIIAEISKLSEDVVRGIAKSIGVTVVG